MTIFVAIILLNCSNTLTQIGKQWVPDCSITREINVRQSDIMEFAEMDYTTCADTRKGHKCLQVQSGCKVVLTEGRVYDSEYGCETYGNK
jgi:hypothetical protein